MSILLVYFFFQTPALGSELRVSRLLGRCSYCLSHSASSVLLNVLLHLFLHFKNSLYLRDRNIFYLFMNWKKYLLVWDLIIYFLDNVFQRSVFNLMNSNVLIFSLCLLLLVIHLRNVCLPNVQETF
jgi:hypothetical protein